MKRIFEQGAFNRYAQVNLNESRSAVLQHSLYAERKTTVFISHKHDDLEDLKGVLGFLQRTYDVKVYIDSQCRPHSTLLCPCQSCWKCNAHTATIFERG